MIGLALGAGMGSSVAHHDGGAAAEIGVGRVEVAGDDERVVQLRIVGRDGRGIWKGHGIGSVAARPSLSTD